jgi:hypothetical protein
MSYALLDLQLQALVPAPGCRNTVRRQRELQEATKACRGTSLSNVNMRSLQDGSPCAGKINE